MLTRLELENVGPAPVIELDLAPRLNLITGDNGLGKSFLLDVAWWALSGHWLSELNSGLNRGYPARPKDIRAKGLIEFGPNVLGLIASRIYSFMNEYVLVAVPMFILMASLMERTGVARDLYRAMYVWAGGLRGGLAVQTLFAAIIMAAMTGIIGGEIVLLGMIALPQMLRLGYQKNIAIGTICAGGSLGTMIPPSIVLIISGLTAGVGKF